MRSWFGICLGAAIAALILGGCAGVRPCPVIPMQLELAQSERDQILEEFERKEAEVQRSDDGLRQAKTRLAQMEEEMEELSRVLDEQDGESEGGAR